MKAGGRFEAGAGESRQLAGRPHERRSRRNPPGWRAGPHNRSTSARRKRLIRPSGFDLDVVAQPKDQRTSKWDGGAWVGLSPSCSARVIRRPSQGAGEFEPRAPFSLLLAAHAGGVLRVGEQHGLSVPSMAAQLRPAALVHDVHHVRGAARDDEAGDRAWRGEDRDREHEQHGC
jgi:hypothetical protein